MFVSPLIDDLTNSPVPVAEAIEGYALNIRAELMANDLKPFVVTPRTPLRNFDNDPPMQTPIWRTDYPDRLDLPAMAQAKPVYRTVFLVFPDQATARASSLGTYWVA